MPIKPQKPFLKIICQSCGWNTIIRQRSDALLSPDTCPACGSASLKHSFNGHIESFLAAPVCYVEALLKDS